MDNWTKIWISILILFFCKGVTGVTATYADDTSLRTTLESGYKQTARPDTPMTVHFFYVLRSLQSLDITQQQMTTTGWFAMHWYDPRLVWNASDYSNISEIDANWAWRPENYVTNAADGFIFHGYDNTKTRFHIFNNGIVRWDLPVHATTSCDVTIAMFPFDKQSCYIEALFMEVNGIDVSLNVSSELETGSYLDNGEWKFEGGEATKIAEYSCCPQSPVTMIHVTLNFTRLRPFYIINLVIPAMLLSVCMVITFLLPTECGERLGFSLTILLSYTVLMSIISDMMPTTSKETPHINIYLLILLIMCSVCVLNVVISVKMFYLESTPPALIQKIVLKLNTVLFCKCCKSNDKVEPSSSDVKVEELTYNGKLNDTNGKAVLESGRREPQEDSKSDLIGAETVTWQFIAETLDRMCFYIYSLACLLLMIIFTMALNGAM